MTWIALVGPDGMESSEFNALALWLRREGRDCAVVRFAREHEFDAALQRLLRREAPPALVVLGIDTPSRAPDLLAIAVALREHGYRGHITATGTFASHAGARLLREAPELDSVMRDSRPGTCTAVLRAAGPKTSAPPPAHVETPRRRPHDERRASVRLEVSGEPQPRDARHVDGCEARGGQPARATASRHTCSDLSRGAFLQLDRGAADFQREAAAAARHQPHVRAALFEPAAQQQQPAL